jgi:hypothetical protein
MWVEGQDDVRLHLLNDLSNRRFDLEHVHICERPRVVSPLALLARRIVESEEHRFADPEARARQAELFGA